MSLAQNNSIQGGCSEVLEAFLVTDHAEACDTTDRWKRRLPKTNSLKGYPVGPSAVANQEQGESVGPDTWLSTLVFPVLKAFLRALLWPRSPKSFSFTDLWLKIQELGQTAGLRPCFPFAQGPFLGRVSLEPPSTGGQRVRSRISIQLSSPACWVKEAQRPADSSLYRAVKTLGSLVALKSHAARERMEASHGTRPGGKVDEPLQSAGS